MRQLLSYLRRRFLPEQDWRDEMEANLELRKEWQRGQGMTGEAAEAQVRKSFGNQTRALEEVRDVYWAHYIDDLVRDLRLALRECWRHPSLFFSAVGSMTLGIAAATAIFSLVDPLLFRPLPYPSGDRLVSLGLIAPIDKSEFILGSQYLDWRDGQTAFSSITAMRPAVECDVTLNRTARIPCVSVEWNFLKTLGVNPSLGRDFLKSEDVPNAPLAAIVSHTFAAVYGGQTAVGSTFKIDGRDARIIGVLPPTFVMPQLGESQVLLPAQLDEGRMRAPENTTFLRAFARLKPDVSLNEARERMAPLVQKALISVPPSLRKEAKFVLRSLRDRQIEEAKAASWLLFLAVLFLLAMSSVNIVNLLLARAEARRQEIGMRRVLGASPWRLLREAVTESLVYGLAGTIFGTVAAVLLIRGISRAAAGGFLRLDMARVDGRVLVFAVGIALLCSLVIGCVPVLHTLGPELLRGEGTRATARRSRLRRVLLSLQIAFSLLLLSGSLLFMRSLLKLESSSPGFVPENLIAVTVNTTRVRYPQSAQLAAFQNEFERRMSTMPGVRSFAVSDSLPPSGGMHGRPLGNMLVDGGSEPLQNGGMVAFRYVTPSYFETMKIPLLSGATFNEADRTRKGASLILSASLARRIFGRANPLGRRIALGGPGSDWNTVIGVVGDAKNDGLAHGGDPEYYRPRLRASSSDHRIIAIFRTTVTAAAVERWARQQMAAIDSSVPVEVTAMPQRLRSLNDRPRFLAVIMSTLAVAAVALAAVGLYGVASFIAASRKREFGVRAALGATRRDLTILVGQDVLVWVAVGAVAGLGAELLAQRYIRSLLFGISASDGASLASAVIVLLLTAVIACFRPALRASKVDPALTLRSE